MEEIDSDNSGKVEFKEFVRVMAKKAESAKIAEKQKEFEDAFRVNIWLDMFSYSIMCPAAVWPWRQRADLARGAALRADGGGQHAADGGGGGGAGGRRGRGPGRPHQLPRAGQDVHRRRQRQGVGYWRTDLGHLKYSTPVLFISIQYSILNLIIVYLGFLSTRFLRIIVKSSLQVW